MLERFPKLKYVVLEIGCGWLPAWKERADGKYEMFSFTTRNEAQAERAVPSAMLGSSDADEEAIPLVARLIGPNRMLWATDYPHIDAHKDPIPELNEKIGSMQPEDQEWILGRGAAELYRL